jgi:tetratricopeptide (TPR) repeat protein
VPVLLGRSTDPWTDLKRADELASRAITVDANHPGGHLAKGLVLGLERRFDDAIAEIERTLALDPSFAEAYGGLGVTYSDIGQYEKAIESFDKAIRLSPQNQDSAFWYSGKGGAYFGLQQYDQTTEWARRAIAINPNFGSPLFILAAALALTGHEAEARDAEERHAACLKSRMSRCSRRSHHLPPLIRAFVQPLTGISRACARPGCRKNERVAIFHLT